MRNKMLNGSDISQLNAKLKFRFNFANFESFNVCCLNQCCVKLKPFQLFKSIIWLPSHRKEQVDDFLNLICKLFYNSDTTTVYCQHKTT